MRSVVALWLLLLWSVGLHAEDADAKPEVSEQRRRLEKLARRLQVVEHEPDLLDERGQTPLLQLGSLKLRHVLTVNRDQPWLIGHAQFPEEYHERRRLHETSDGEGQGFRRGSRRLSDIQSDLLKQVADTPYVFTIPRDRVRLFAALNAAAVPETAWTNASLTYWQAGGKVHVDPGAMLFTPNRPTINNESLTGSGWTQKHTGGWTIASMGNNFSGSADVVGNAYRDGQALRGARSKIRGAANQQSPGWKQDEFLGIRTFACTEKTQQDPRCWTDPGVALSVYEEQRNKVIVFHADWSINWYEYLLWHHRAWIIDNLETQVKNQWTIDSQQVVTPEMKESRGEQNDENQERCAFKDQANKPFVDIDSFAKVTGFQAELLSSEGYWSLVKRMLRIVLPEGRDLVAEKTMSIYLTGSGSGGTWAALSTMFLKKTDDVKYETFLIAGEGYGCYARTLSADMNPWEDHDQIKIYAHVMDIYARMDFVSGYKCLYGLYNMTEASDVHFYCSGIVGRTGPQLLYRGPPVGMYLGTDTEAALKRSKVVEARTMFDACHYFTHSPWYAAMLFVDENVLMRDGTTDGGCKAEQSIPQTDQLGRCPTASGVESDCSAIEDVSVPFPWVACAVVAAAMAAFFCILAITLNMFLKLIDNKMWVFTNDEREGKSLGVIIWQLFLSVVCICRKHKKAKKSKRKEDKAARARDRVYQAQLKKFHRSREGSRKKNKNSQKTEEVAEEKGQAAWKAVKSKLGVVSQMHDSHDHITQAAGLVGNTTAPPKPIELSNETSISEALHEAHIEHVEPTGWADGHERQEEEQRRAQRRQRKEERRKEKARKREKRGNAADNDREGDRDEAVDLGQQIGRKGATEDVSEEEDLRAEEVLRNARTAVTPSPQHSSVAAAARSSMDNPASAGQRSSGDAEAKLPLTEDMDMSNIRMSLESTDSKSNHSNRLTVPGTAESKARTPVPKVKAKSKPKSPQPGLHPVARRASSHVPHSAGGETSPRPAKQRRASSHVPRSPRGEVSPRPALARPSTAHHVPRSAGNAASPRPVPSGAAASSSSQPLLGRQDASPRPVPVRRSSASSTRSVSARGHRSPRGENSARRTVSAHAEHRAPKQKALPGKATSSTDHLTVPGSSSSLHPPGSAQDAAPRAAGLSGGSDDPDLL